MENEKVKESFELDGYHYFHCTYKALFGMGNDFYARSTTGHFVSNISSEDYYCNKAIFESKNKSEKGR